MNKKIIRITTVPQSLRGLLGGQLKYMSQHYEVIGISSSGDGLLDEVCNSEGIRVIPVEMTRKITPIKDLRTTWQLYLIFKNEKPFIVHTHTPKAGTLGMMAAYFARVPNRLHTIAGLPLLEARGSKRMLLDLVEKITYCCATKIYPNSFGLKNIIIKNKYTKIEKLKVIGNGSSNGIDTDYFKPSIFKDSDKQGLKTSLGIEKNDFVFVFIGRLVKDKGINELVQAFSRISDKYNNTKLLLLGSYEEDLDPLLPEIINAIDTNSNIIPVGVKKDVRPYFAISNVLTFPSYREGFPNVVMEAGAMGIPSIVTNINGCNEIIIEGKNGWIIPPKEEEILFETMEKCYLNYNNGIILDKNEIRSMITSRFNRLKIWGKILNEYGSLM